MQQVESGNWPFGNFRKCSLFRKSFFQFCFVKSSATDHQTHQTQAQWWPKVRRWILGDSVGPPKAVNFLRETPKQHGHLLQCLSISENFTADGTFMIFHGFMRLTSILLRTPTDSYDTSGNCDRLQSFDCHEGTSDVWSDNKKLQLACGWVVSIWSKNIQVKSIEQL